MTVYLVDETGNRSENWHKENLLYGNPDRNRGKLNFEPYLK